MSSEPLTVVAAVQARTGRECYVGSVVHGVDRADVDVGRRAGRELECARQRPERLVSRADTVIGSIPCVDEHGLGCVLVDVDP
jgi:hypothetical protein